MNTAEDGRPIVLVADGEPDLLSVVEYALKDAGYEVLAARDGEEALRIALDPRPTSPCST